METGHYPDLSFVHPTLRVLAFRTLVGPIFDLRMVLEWNCARQHHRFGAFRANLFDRSAGHSAQWALNCQIATLLSTVGACNGRGPRRCILLPARPPTRGRLAPRKCPTTVCRCSEHSPSNIAPYGPAKERIAAIASTMSGGVGRDAQLLLT
jgi:hypothetical protein